MNPLVSIIIVNWNSRDNLKECLDSLLKIDYTNYEIILVDNGSIDGSLEFVEKEYPKIITVKSEKNLGFAGGNNLGLRESRGKYVLFLNNDTIVTKSFLSDLVKFVESDSSIGVVQPTIIFHRPGTILHHKINSVGSFLLNSGFLYHMDYGKTFKKENYNLTYEIFSAYGACFLARRSVIDRVGLFDPDYFAYFEETDFCHRVWLSGLKVMIYTKPFIYHKGAKTAEKLPTAFIQYHSFKNRLYTYLKNLDSLNIIKVFIPHFIVCEISSLMYLAIGKPGYTLAIQKSIIWNILNFRKILKERRRVQDNIRKIGDGKFIPELTKKVDFKYYYYLSSGELEKYKE